MQEPRTGRIALGCALPNRYRLKGGPMIALWCQDCQKAVTRNTAGGCEVCGSPQVRERVRPNIIASPRARQRLLDMQMEEYAPPHIPWLWVFVVGAALCWAL